METCTIGCGLDRREDGCYHNVRYINRNSLAHPSSSYGVHQPLSYRQWSGVLLIHGAHSNCFFSVPMMIIIWWTVTGQHLLFNVPAAISLMGWMEWRTLERENTGIPSDNLTFFPPPLDGHAADSRRRRGAKF